MDRSVYEYISQQTNDPIIQRHTCEISGESFPIYQSDKELYDKLSPSFNGQKSQIPLPKLCPEERAKKRYLRRNINNFFKRTCDFSDKDIIALYPQNSPYKIYHQDIRFSDVRDPMKYEKDFDFSQSFFSQFDTLLKKVPRMALINTNSDNCQYANYIKDGKNCYMTSITYYDCENLAYAVWIMDGKDSADCLNCRHIQRCLESSDCNNIFSCTYLHESNNCRQCHFSANLNNCEYCFFCSNLVNSSYCIQNKQYTKEEYYHKLSEIKKNKSRYPNMKIQYKNLLLTRTVKALDMTKVENSIGNHLYNCENTFFTFGGENIQDSKYVIGENLTDCMDMTGGTAQLAYQSTNVGLQGTSNLIGCVSILNSHHMYYCDNCYENCSYCFGCAGLRNKQYCILNKQYTKDERERQVAQIINHMIQTKERGEFFPISMSPFAYNISRAQERYPLTKQEAEAKNYPRHDNDHPTLKEDGYTPKEIENYDPTKIDSNIAEQNKKELLSSIIKCTETGRGFRIVPTELDVYVKLGTPIPTTHPDQRYQERYARLAPKNLYLNTCAKTQKTIISVYPPSKTNVLSDEIYNQQVYG